MSVKRTLYLAGGCFWGVARFFSGVDGVSSVVAGYANGNGEKPSYEEVYTDRTGFAETVQLTYDPERVSLPLLLQLYFALIDPTAVNRQGPDVGTRYRSGIWWSDEASAREAAPVLSEMQARYGAALAVEWGPLRNFYPAEESNQDYLEKNPGGYCHVSLRAFRYQKLIDAARLQLEGESDPVARMATLSALIHKEMGFFWVGFYRVAGDGLVVGPYQGDPACLRIAHGRGVCGSAWSQDRTLVVPDVEAFPGHIACSSKSRSEIVVPVHDASGAVCAVLDIDSTEKGAFTEEDARFLELLLSLFIW